MKRQQKINGKHLPQSRRGMENFMKVFLCASASLRQVGFCTVR
jgi:hypothetical protein